jgi:exopolyphosphatase/guanosine-5'-triphosphate,3'-diphosphate pyrophosphatase
MVPAASMRDISRMMSPNVLEERAALPCIGLERADPGVAGCAILDGDSWTSGPAKTRGVARSAGIPEGIRALAHGQGRTPDLKRRKDR